jgi:nucleotide-binding universal stress UspA family protein
MFKKIVVPLDGSAVAERALNQVLSLAYMVHGEVILLHVIKPALIWTSPHERFKSGDSAEQACPAALEYLQKVQTTYQQPDITFRLLVREGDEASAIVDTADSEEANLIVMSAHGHSGITRWMLGSVAEKALQGASCPMLLVRSSHAIQKILITLDGSELAEQALLPGLDVARYLGAQVTLLHVSSLLPLGQLEAVQFEWVMGQGPEAQQVAKIQSGAQAYLERIVRSYQPYAGREIEAVVETGLVANTILKFADSHQFDLIAMSTHGRTGLNRWLYGSVTSKVLHHSPCSMLIVRPPAMTFSSS